MSLIVQKFGGTSVADCEKILAAARKAIRAHKEGHQVVMVVSAMGKNTDILVDLADQICSEPSAREMDMLLSTGEQVSVALMAMAIHSLGDKAVSLTGAQIGVKTDSTHTKARIRSIETGRVRKLLDDGNIVIAAGFQGIDDDFNITTLGRGGSDTSAVSLAAVLDANECEIYTDVDGVYTTDPRILPEARKVNHIAYDEMLELASLGAGVMHSRSIEFGKKFHVPIHVRSSFSDAGGTIICPLPESDERPVSGAALTDKEARVSIENVPDKPGTSLAIFSKIAEKAIAVDMIVQNVGANGKANISFTVLESDLQATLSALEEIDGVLTGAKISHHSEAAKVSVVGLGMAVQTGVAETMFRALADAGINIQLITTSEIKISVLVDRDQARDALRVVHSAFLLDQAPKVSVDRKAVLAKAAEVDAAAVVARLAGLEDLAIDDIVLDATQARVTVAGIPDEPGVAARVFEEVAAAGINVDMIVQNSGRDGRANVSFTVPKSELEDCIAACEKLGESLQLSGISSSGDIAKLSVSGIGLRSHTGVAMRMFGSLSAAGINVEMVSTSEVRVNVVVDGASGQPALECLQQAFADVLR